MALILSDFNSAGMSKVEALALLTSVGIGANTGGIIYADSDRGGTSTPDAGELGLGTGETVISRILRNADHSIVLNDNDEPTALSLRDFFIANSDLRFYIQTEAGGVESLAITGSAIENYGGGFLRLVIPTHIRDIFDGIVVGTKFIIAIANPGSSPRFQVNTGESQAWTPGAAIAPLTVDAATGFPAPSYSASGLPNGILFNTSTRVISGTPTSGGSGTITITATNFVGTTTWTVAYATAGIAPSFTDDTGNGQVWVDGTTIAPLTVAAAAGNPTPTYAATDLPNGIAFDASTRVISGTPTAVGSGTITITATNREGSATWTVAYATTGAAPIFVDDTGNNQAWELGANITPLTVPEAVGSPVLTYAARGLPNGVRFNTSTRVISGSPTAVGSGTITVTVTNSEGSATWTVAYVTTDPVPAFADNTGDNQVWVRGASIAPITVAEATGNPTPTYAARGLPNGVAFNTSTRVISGTPTATGSGTITVTATNSEGTATWTVAYTITGTAPVFTDNTGNDQAWTLGTRITPITVAAASGNPPPTYAARGLPNGVAFNTSTRVISGTPRTAGNGTITVVAHNSEGTATWTVAYTAFDPAPVFIDNTGNNQVWTRGANITPITVAAATGNPTPTYAASGLPSGILFNASTRVISGSPTATGSGNITITATNSEGSATWTVAYTTNANLIGNVFTDGDQLIWIPPVTGGLDAALLVANANAPYDSLAVDVRLALNVSQFKTALRSYGHSAVFLTDGRLVSNGELENIGSTPATFMFGSGMLSTVATTGRPVYVTMVGAAAAKPLGRARFGKLYDAFTLVILTRSTAAQSGDILGTASSSVYIMQDSDGVHLTTRSTDSESVTADGLRSSYNEQILVAVYNGGHVSWYSNGNLSGSAGEHASRRLLLSNNIPIVASPNIGFGGLSVIGKALTAAEVLTLCQSLFDY